MGWSDTPNDIFDPVARALIEARATDGLKRNVLGVLIQRLRYEDWDTADDSLKVFAHDPGVVAAFADNGIRRGTDE
jgi:hypothetical protein